MAAVSPIALFTYNRPWHTRQTVEALQKNELSAESELIIFSDGPRTASDYNAVEEVRKFIRTIQGFKQVHIVEREKNLGLSRSIISGVTEIIGTFGRAIVLEDDLVAAPYFLSYMNDALALYENEHRVMQISGYVFPIDPSALDETFFLRTTSSWGWATWKRSWSHFEPDVKVLLNKFTTRSKYQFNLRGAYDYWGMLDSQQRGKIDSWAVRWYASVFLSEGLCLFPVRSLIQNIGHDGTGVHCGVSTRYAVTLHADRLTRYPAEIRENELALEGLIRFYKNSGPVRSSGMLTRLLHMLRRSRSL